MLHDRCAVAARYELRTAQGESELEAVFRFRYEHFFQYFADGYPGIDRARSRLIEPHDPDSTHYCAFDPAGNLCAVSTATRASFPGIPESWKDWLQIARLAPLGLDRTVISTRMVIHPDHRHSGLFGRFYRFIISRYLEAGFSYAAHYCSPGMVSLHEHLGHRVYAEPFVMPPELLRVPMLIALNELEYLGGINPSLAEMCASYALPPPAVPLAEILPELSAPPLFHLLSPRERLSYVRARLGRHALPDGIGLLEALENASLLRLRKGMSHTPQPRGGFLALVLSGAIREFGKERTAGPGSFAGADMLHCQGAPPPPPFSVAADSEIVVFNQAYTRTSGRHLLSRLALPDQVMLCGTR